MSINNRLREVMEYKGLSIKAFAELLDVPYRTLQNYLLNERDPSAEVLIKISDVLNVDLNWLMRGEGEMFRGSMSESKLNEKEIAELSIYMAITPYVQSNLVKTNINTWQNRATAFLETYISYIINTIDKDKFSKDLNEMKDILNLSDKFYEGLLSYFKESDEIISNCILEKL